MDYLGLEYKQAPAALEGITGPTVLLCGPTQCSHDWQNNLGIMLVSAAGHAGQRGTILNPRQEYPCTLYSDLTVHRDRYRWDLAANDIADVKAFWFTKGDDEANAITHLINVTPSQTVVVGIDPGHGKSTGLRQGIAQLFPNIRIHESLVDLCHAIISELSMVETRAMVCSQCGREPYSRNEWHRNEWVWGQERITRTASEQL